MNTRPGHLTSPAGCITTPLVPCPLHKHTIRSCGWMLFTGGAPRLPGRSLMHLLPGESCVVSPALHACYNVALEPPGTYPIPLRPHLLTMPLQPTGDECLPSA